MPLFGMVNEMTSLLNVRYSPFFTATSKGLISLKRFTDYLVTFCRSQYEYAPGGVAGARLT
jgi:hypothetical protein